jgi:hypothetical protein
MADATALTKELMVAASELGARLFRQNTGLAWVGKVMHIRRAKTVAVKPGDVVIRGARPFRSGRKGMADLGGWMPVEVTPDMVGKTIAVYAQVEVKTTDRPSPEQLQWIEMVRGAGGIAGIAHDEVELREILTTTYRST